MILLDIPQGAITIASAILVVVAGALVTFAAFLFRQLFSIRDRLKAVETKVEPFDVPRVGTSDWR